MKRGEVWRVRLASVPGHTQAGIRPAVIVQEDRSTAALPTVLVVPFTSTQAALRFPGTLAVLPDGQNGLTLPSVALVFQLAAVDKIDCLQRLGVLDAATLDQVFAELDKLTGRCPPRAGHDRPLFPCSTAPGVVSSNSGRKTEVPRDPALSDVPQRA
jgi:mRNA interferase MazF